jgi:hypothetical protein
MIFFIYNLNQQLEFTFYKLMLWLLQCLDGSRPAANPRTSNQVNWPVSFKSSCFEERVFVGSECSVMFVAFLWMTSCTYDMPRSACSVALETYCTMVQEYRFILQKRIRANVDWPYKYTFDNFPIMQKRFDSLSHWFVLWQSFDTGRVLRVGSLVTANSISLLRMANNISSGDAVWRLASQLLKNVPLNATYV